MDTVIHLTLLIDRQGKYEGWLRIFWTLDEAQAYADKRNAEHPETFCVIETLIVPQPPVPLVPDLTEEWSL